MAVINKLYKSMGLPMNIKRGNPWPLDVSSVWYSYNEMKAYAEDVASVSYVGQILALVDESNNSAEVYIITDKNGSLKPVGSGSFKVDNKTIIINEESDEISLKDFGKRFYKFIPAEKDIETGEIIKEFSYELVDVDENNPWRAGLEPRTVVEDGVLVLGWFEQNTTTIDGVNAQISSLQTSLFELEDNVKDLSNNVLILENQKANVSDVFNKQETLIQINQALSATNHLQRKIVNSYLDITNFILEHGEKEASKYIFMVPDDSSLTEGNIYEEYLVVDGIIEIVGKWSTDLTDYATKTDLTEALLNYATKENLNTDVNALTAAIEKKVTKKDGYGLISDEDLEKLRNLNETGEENFINSVSSDFSVDENRRLILNKDILDLSKNATIINLNTKIISLETKAETISNDISALEQVINANSKSIENLHSAQAIMQDAINKNKSDIVDLKTNTGKLQTDLNNALTLVEKNTTNITKLQLELNNYVLKESYEADMEEIKDILTWKNISN